MPTIKVLSKIPTDENNYYASINSINSIAKNIPIINFYGAGILPAGMFLSNIYFDTSSHELLLPTDNKETSTPDIVNNNYNLLNGNAMGASSAALENIILCLQTNYDSSSIEGFGLLKRPIIPVNYQTIIGNDIKDALSGLLESGMITNLKIQLDKDGSRIYCKLSFFDNTIGINNSYQHAIG